MWNITWDNQCERRKLLRIHGFRGFSPWSPGPTASGPWGGKSWQTCPVEGSCPLNGRYQESKQRGRIWGANIPSKGTSQWLNFFPEGLLSQNLHYLPKVQKTKSLTHVLGGYPNQSSMVLAGQVTGTPLCARCNKGNKNRFFPLQSQDFAIRKGK